MDWYLTAVPERRQRLSRRAIAEPVVTGTRPPIKNDNVNGFSIIISWLTSEIHTRESAKSPANVHQYLPEMG
jgi:hypothetical protein